MSTLSNWPAPEKPREKLLRLGSHTLSDAELLAIFLRTGTSGCHVIELAHSLLQKFGGLRQILQSDLDDFCQHKGLGPAKYVQLQACIEMTKRHAWQKLTQHPIIHSTEQAVCYLQSCLGHRQEEVIAVMMLNPKLRVIHYQELASGNAQQVCMSLRQLATQVLKYHASYVIMAHNHPSGDANPSDTDCDMTLTAKDFLAQLDITLIDHIIIAHQQHYSFAAQGRLKSHPIPSQN